VVTLRARIHDAQPAGVMLAVQASTEQVAPLLTRGATIAVINGKDRCVVGGSPEAISAFEGVLQKEELQHRRVKLAGAPHTPLMDGALAPLREVLASVKLQAPQIELLSCYSTERADFTSAEYWVQHLRQTVRFSAMVDAVGRSGSNVFIEVGPGHTLSRLVTRQLGASEHRVIASQEHEDKDEQAALLGALGKVWCAGVEPDWDALHGEKRRRVNLPTYAFEQRRYWVDAVPAQLPRSDSIDDMCHVPFWRVAPPPQASVKRPSGTWVIFCDELGVGSEVARRLVALGEEIIEVHAGASLEAQGFAEQLGGRSFTIDPADESHYGLLVERIKASGGTLGNTLHLWGYPPAKSLPAERWRERCFDCLIFWARALDKSGNQAAGRLVIATSESQSVSGQEEVRAEKALAIGPLRMIPLEYPHIQCRIVDLALAPGAAELLFNELISDEPDPLVAYRQRRRWVQSFARVHLGDGSVGRAYLRAGGTYLITGGLGGIGLTFAGYLARTCKAKLVLVGRTGLPPKGAWTEYLTSCGESSAETCRRIEQVMELEKHASEVLVCEADVSDLTQMSSVIERTHERFGAIAGVIHAAGSLKKAQYIFEATRAVSDHVLGPKVAGSRVLEQVLREEPLDFFVLCSSLNAIRGGVAVADYVSANAFLDLFAQEQQRLLPERKTVSINWNAWREVGMAAREHAASGRAFNEDAISPSEGLDIFERVLGMGETQVAVSRSELRLELTGAAVSAEDVADAGSADDTTVYANDNERRLAALWREVLSQPRVERTDDFFALGGDSLSALQLVARLRERLNVSVSMRLLLERPMLSQMAALIETTMTQGALPRLVSRARRPAHVPLSYAQQRLFFLHQLEPESVAYHVTQNLRIGGPLDVKAFERALNGVIARHESLRTTFLDVAGFTEQVVHAQLPVAIEWLESSGRYRERPFDLQRGPLVRCAMRHSGRNDTGEAEHEVFLSMHHIVSDGWSVGVFWRELSALYNGESLPPLSVQYVDFALWQREHVKLDTQEAYWKQKLSGAPAALELPTDRPRPAMMSHRGALYACELPMAGDILELGRSERATLFMSLLAAFDVLLARYSGQDDFVIGTAVSNRQLEATESLIGFFVNTLCLRVDLGGNPSFRELLRRVKETALEGYAHQDLPFEKLVEVLNPERSTARSPVFQVAFALEAVTEGGRELARGLTLTGQAELEVQAKFDLIFTVIENQGRLGGVIEYATDLFDRETIERMAEHYRHLLNAIVKNPDEKIGALEMLSEAERKQLAVVAQRDYRSDECMHALFAAQARKTPEAVAVVFEDQTLSYRALDERSNQLAHALQKRGVGPETLVAICVERSAEMVVGLLGILKAGGAYVPLDPSYPRDRLEYMLADSAARVLVTSGNAANGFVAEMVVRMEEIGNESTTAPRVAVSADAPAYVIYTSGSTGRPKGVIVTHRNVARLFTATEQWYHFSSQDVWTLFHSYAFDFSVWEIWGALLYGGRLVVVPYLVSRSPGDFFALLRREGVTVLNQTPSAFRQLIEVATDSTSLRLVIFGGEALDLRTLRPWFERYGDQKPELVNMYGITETTVHVTYRPIRLADVEQNLGSVIGRGIDDLAVYVLDKHGQPQPVGVVGELYVGGAGLARGYLNRPELTAERFAKHPTYGRLYKTGDLARRLRNGDLEYLGRNDNQVKIRGFRIELGEIEAVLRRQESVQDVAVVANESRDLLVAYVVPDDKTARPVRRLPALKRRKELSFHEVGEGMIVAHLNRSETEFLYKEIFVDDTYAKHGVVVGADACVFDVGANIGLFSISVSLKGAKARIFAFEPIPPLCEILQANVDLYGVDAKVFCCGLSDRPGSATFTFYRGNSVMSGRFANMAEDAALVKSYLQHEGTGGTSAKEMDELLTTRLAGESYDCALKTISQVIAEEKIERIDLLKVDVEKAEWEVLSGIEAQDWPKIRQAVIEVHDTAGRLRQVVALLERHGFTVAVEQNRMLSQTHLYDVYARRGGEIEATRGAGYRWMNGRALEAELRQQAREQLPEFMIPSAFVMLDALPLTPNGKLDRQALPEPERGGQSEYVAPRNVAEELIAGAFAEILRIERPIGVDDDFFALGGHSLLATQLVSRLAKIFGKAIALKTLFEAPRVGELALRVADAERTSLPALVAKARPERVPLSYAQQRLFFLSQLEPESLAYNIQTVLKIHGRLDEVAFERALNGVIARHEILRTTFALTNGPPEQVVHDAMPVAVERVATFTADEPFDLQRGPLLRCQLRTLAPAERELRLIVHHIVFDAWSMAVLWSELWALYEGDGARGLPNLPVQYADYTLWQREHVVLDRQEEYWKSKLSGAPILELATDRPRPARASHRGAVCGFSIDVQTARALRQLCQGEGSTLFMTLLAVFESMMGRYSGQDDFVIGTPIANRQYEATEALIGFFVNTLCMRADLGGKPTFRQLVNRVKQTAIEAYANQDLSFERLIEVLNPERSTARNPVFQVMFAWQNAPGVAGKPLADVSIEGVASDEPGSVQFDLTLRAQDSVGGGIDAHIAYATDLFDQETVERMVDHFRLLCEAVVRDPDAPVAAVDISSAGERQKLIEWNDTRKDYAERRLVYELFEEHARRTPDAVAVSFEGQSLSYAALNKRANQLAHHLIGRGVGPDKRVALCLERSLEMVVAIFGVVKAGGAYLPLDPTTPKDRLAEMLKDSEPTVTLSQSRFPKSDEHVLWLDTEWERVAVERDENPARRATDDDLAYVIYTSGSTGKPKGVMNVHAGLRNRLMWMQSEYRLDETDTVLQKTPYTFDVSVWEFFWPLMAGAKLVLAKPDGHRDPAYLADLIEQENITTLHFVPSMLQAFLPVVEAKRCANLKRVFCSGEALPIEVSNRLLSSANAELHNLYGPTEASIDVTYWQCRAQADHVPIGKPIANTQIHVLDQEGAAAPIGVPGELHIGGVGLARGYLNRPELTAERFFEHPRYGRLYKTGDMARWTAAGVIEYLGRNDHQIKLRGFRIELGEIEATMRKYVGEAVVVVHGADSNKQLVGYYVGEKTARELKDDLKTQLPDYMVPAILMPIDALPLTSSGKVDRKRLPRPTFEVNVNDVPRSQLEQQIAQLWCELLGLPRVGLSDHFFDVGGHSLLLIKLREGLEKIAGRPVLLMNLFEHTTVEAQARAFASSANEPDAQAQSKNNEPNPTKRRGAKAFDRFRPR
ncbi:MAG: amino acid adenylation domain-containing protein, partial [Deltaproteobacteria bacterium]|nr:amino acid adenylation domain-containing protein [Deltaproteobacteria bacterium]